MKTGNLNTTQTPGPMALAIWLGAAAAVTLASGSPADAQEDPEFSETRVIIEINATDGDAGLHGITDADDWRKFTLKAPDRAPIYRVRGFNAVMEQGLTENFFESSEPPCEEQPLEDFLDRFPAGTYRWRGRTNDEEPIRAAAALTHALPAAPEALAPTGSGIDATSPIVISWEKGATLGNCPPGSADVPAPADVELFGYQVIVARELPLPLVEVIVEVPPEQTSITLPAEFVSDAAVFKYEVVAIELRTDDEGEAERGNQVLSEAFFCTTGLDPCEVPD